MELKYVMAWSVRTESDSGSAQSGGNAACDRGMPGEGSGVQMAERKRRWPPVALDWEQGIADGSDGSSPQAEQSTRTGDLERFPFAPGHGWRVAAVVATA